MSTRCRSLSTSDQGRRRHVASLKQCSPRRRVPIVSEALLHRQQRARRRVRDKRSRANSSRVKFYRRDMLKCFPTRRPISLDLRLHAVRSIRHQLLGRPCMLMRVRVERFEEADPAEATPLWARGSPRSNFLTRSGNPRLLFPSWGSPSLHDSSSTSSHINTTLQKTLRRPGCRSVTLAGCRSSSSGPVRTPVLRRKEKPNKKTTTRTRRSAGRTRLRLRAFEIGPTCRAPSRHSHLRRRCPCRRRRDQQPDRLGPGR